MSKTRTETKIITVDDNAPSSLNVTIYVSDRAYQRLPGVGYSGGGGRPPIAVPAPGQGFPIGLVRLMPVGDSITEGDFYGGYRGVLGAGEPYTIGTGWAAGSPGGYTFTFVGPFVTGSLTPNYAGYDAHSGATVEQIENGNGAWSMPSLASAIVTNTPDVLTVHCGTNNYFSEDGPTVTGRIATLLAAARGTRIVLSTTIDNQDATTHGRIVAGNALLPGVVANENGLGGKVVLVDGYTQLGIYNGSNYADGTHPNRTGYEIWEPVWHAGILAALALA